MAAPKVVSQSEWNAAREEFWKKEFELAKLKEELIGIRKQLPAVKVTKNYTFTSPEGEKVSLEDLFEGRKQLLVYHFMFSPTDETGCGGCSFFVDNIPHLAHLNSRDTTLVLVSRAPVERLSKWKERMDWPEYIHWYSTNDGDFSYDFAASYGPGKTQLFKRYLPAPGEEEKEKQKEEDPKKNTTGGDMPGITVFYKTDEGDILHTYAALGPEIENMNSTWDYLIITPDAPDLKNRMRVGFSLRDAKK